MNIQELHTANKPISAIPFFKGTEGKVTALHIRKREELKEHITKVPALLVCCKGEAIYSDKNGVEETLLPGDFVNIEVDVLHKVNAIASCDLLLIK